MRLAGSSTSSASSHCRPWVQTCSQRPRGSRETSWPATVRKLSPLVHRHEAADLAVQLDRRTPTPAGGQGEVLEGVVRPAAGGRQDRHAGRAALVDGEGQGLLQVRVVLVRARHHGLLSKPFPHSRADGVEVAHHRRRAETDGCQVVGPAVGGQQEARVPGERHMLRPPPPRRVGDDHRVHPNILPSPPPFRPGERGEGRGESQEDRERQRSTGSHRQNPNRVHRPWVGGALPSPLYPLPCLYIPLPSS